VKRSWRRLYGRKETDEGEIKMSITRSLSLIKKTDTSDILTRMDKDIIRDISWKDRCFDMWLSEFLAAKHSWEIVSTSDDPVFMARISYPVMLELVETLEKEDYAYCEDSFGYFEGDEDVYRIIRNMTPYFRQMVDWYMEGEYEFIYVDAGD